MSVVDRYLANPKSKWNHFCLWVSVTLPEVKYWCLRWVYAQRTYRELIELEDNMVSVIYEATGGMMSKPNYTKDAMLQMIRQHHADLYDDGYKDGHKDGYEAIPDFGL